MSSSGVIGIKTSHSLRETQSKASWDVNLITPCRSILLKSRTEKAQSNLMRNLRMFLPSSCPKTWVKHSFFYSPVTYQKAATHNFNHFCFNTNSTKLTMLILLSYAQLNCEDLHHDQLQELYKQFRQCDMWFEELLFSHWPNAQAFARLVKCRTSFLILALMSQTAETFHVIREASAVQALTRKTKQCFCMQPSQLPQWLEGDIL